MRSPLPRSVWFEKYLHIALLLCSVALCPCINPSSLPRSWTSLVWPARPTFSFGGREIWSITCNENLGLAGQIWTTPHSFSLRPLNKKLRRKWRMQRSLPLPVPCRTLGSCTPACTLTPPTSPSGAVTHSPGASTHPKPCSESD